MFIQSNNYQLKTTEDEVFVTVHTNEFPVSFVAKRESAIIFASRNELFSKTGRDIKKIASFDSDITALHVDGDLVCAGARSGAVQILADFRKCIRSYFEHTAAVNAVRVFSCPRTGDKIVVSCSDDSSVRFYRLLEEKSYLSHSHGGKPVRSLDVLGSMVFAGSSTLRGYCVETDKELFKYENEATISHICILDDARVAFAFRNKISIIKLADRSIITRIAHAKSVVRLVNYCGVLYTASADGRFRSYTHQLKRISDINLKKRITSFWISEDSPVISLEDGVVVGLPTEPMKKVEVSKAPKKFGYEETTEVDIVMPAKKRLTEVDAMLERFQYKDSLKLIMQKKDLALSFSVLKRLQDARALKKALVGEGVAFIEEFLNFTLDHFNITEFTGIFMEALIIITTVYAELILTNNSLKELLDLIKEVVDEEVAFQELCLKSVSFLECFKNKF